jgi:hypothetical protein
MYFMKFILCYFSYFKKFYLAACIINSNLVFVVVDNYHCLIHFISFYVVLYLILF